MSDPDLTKTNTPPEARAAENPQSAPAGVNDGGAAESGRPSAIERQAAAVAALLAERESQQNAQRRKHGGRRGGGDDEPDRPWFALAAAAVIVFLAALLGSAAYPQFHVPADAAWAAIEQQVERIGNAVNPPPLMLPGKAPPPPPTVASEPARAAPPATRAALAVPIENITLRDRPELLEQLVALNRSLLAVDATDAAARDVLARLRDKTVAELEAISGEGNVPLTVASRDIVRRVFPELSENPRYQLLSARVDQMQASAPATIVAAPPATTADNASIAPGVPAEKATPGANETLIEKELPIGKPMSVATASSASTTKVDAQTPTAPAEAPTAKSAPRAVPEEVPAEKAVSGKPDIRVLSVTPGRMDEGRFMPTQGGNIFMMVINYRNLTQRGADEANLDILLGNVGDRQVLAEASINVRGDRGTRSIPLETFVAGFSGETYKLNLILDGKLVGSRTVRLSSP